jgi:hypothetical protein
LEVKNVKVFMAAEVNLLLKYSKGIKFRESTSFAYLISV